MNRLVQQSVNSGRRTFLSNSCSESSHSTVLAISSHKIRLLLRFPFRTSEGLYDQYYISWNGNRAIGGPSQRRFYHGINLNTFNLNSAASSSVEVALSLSYSRRLKDVENDTATLERSQSRIRQSTNFTTNDTVRNHIPRHLCRQSPYYHNIFMILSGTRPGVQFRYSACHVRA